MIRKLAPVLVLLLSQPLFAATRTWTGANSANWSDGANWSPSGAPAAGDTLQFPSGAPHTAMVDDLPAGTSFGPMSFDANGYSVSGSAMTLTGDVAYGAGVGVVWNSNLTVGVSLRIGDPPSAGSTFNGAVDVNGRTLLLLGGATRLNGPLQGTGMLNGVQITIGAGGNFSGAINSSVEVHGALPDANVIGGLSGDGTIGTAYVPSACFPQCRLSPAGALSTKSLRVDGTHEVAIVPGGTPNVVYVTGTVTLAGNLSVSLPSGSPLPGQVFTLIDNDGTDAVAGTYFHMPERTIVNVNGSLFRVSYKGGDGNDVVLIATAPTQTTLTQTSATTKYGEPWTVTATVASPAGTPTGTITWVVDNVFGGTAPLQDGAASLTLSGLEPGSHSVLTMYVDSGNSFTDNTSAGLPHQVAKGDVSVAISSDRTSTRYGESVRFTVNAGVQAPAAGALSGYVTILADGSPIDAALVVDGVATVFTSALHTGTTSIRASYDGDPHFNANISPGITQVVSKAPTTIDARTANSIYVGAVPVIQVLIRATTNASFLASGQIVTTEDGHVLDTQALINGKAPVRLPPLPPGDHSLVIAYGGSADFEPSSVTVKISVALPVLSVHGAHVVEGAEGTTTTVSLPVTLSAPVTVPVRVSFVTVAGSAEEGSDFEKASGVVEFAPGEQTKAIELHILGDGVPEGEKTFSVVLFDAVNAALEPPSAVVVIDDRPARRRAVQH